GDDAEGVDAGELAYYENSRSADQDRAATTIGGVTPRLWPDRDARGAEVASGAAHSGVQTAIGGMLSNVPPSPELLAKVAALPPAGDEPSVDQSTISA